MLVLATSSAPSPDWRLAVVLVVLTITTATLLRFIAAGRVVRRDLRSVYPR